MDEKLDGSEGFFAEVRSAFPLEAVDLRTYSPLALAFLGDGVYEMVIRSLIVGRDNLPPGELHRRTSHLVRAEAQAQLMDAIEDRLTDEEADWYRRGKNAKPATMPQHASAGDYHKATGCETLMGALYLTGQERRMLELIRMGLTALGAPEAGE